MVNYEYQQKVIFWLPYMKSALIADDMGLGKSLEIIQSIKIRKRKKILFASSKTGINAFKKEIEKWDENTIIQTIYDKVDKNYKWFLCTYSQGKKILNNIDKYSFDCIVLDEIHNLKNKKTIQYNIWNQIIISLDNRIDFSIYGMTATPVINRKDDLLNIAYLLMGREKVNNVYKFLRNITIRRTKEDVVKSDNIKFPDISFDIHIHSLNPIQQGLIKNYSYSRKRTTFYTKEKQIIISEKMVIDTLTFQDRIEKIKKIILEKGDEKIIIYSQYRKSLKLLAERLNMPYLYIDGTKSLKKRNTIINEFQNNNDIKILLITFKTGGESLNLPDIKNIIMMDLWWTYASLIQAINRIHRITSQYKKADIDIFIIPNTIEGKNIKILLEKRKLLDDVKRYHNKVFDF